MDIDGTVHCEDTFTRIYEKCEWGRDKNGYGTSGIASAPKNAQKYVLFLQRFLKKNQIKSVVDLGCGDWELGKHIDWTGIDYRGYDVVQKVIENNQIKYSSPSITFHHADATKENIPSADLLICKDVLQHLSISQIHTILQQFKKYKYCVITNDVEEVPEWGAF